MRTWSIVLGIAIFICIVSVSFSHTVDLYLRVGFLLWEARLATFAVEATFLLSGWSILWYRMQKKDPGKAAYIGFFFGSFMALFSNSAYTVGLDWLFDNKVAQWVLAISVVACVGISEAIISQNLLGRKMDKSTNQLADQRSKMADQPATSASHSTTVNQVADQKSASQPSGRKVVDQSTSHVSRNSQQSTTVNRSISQSDQPVAESVSQVAEVAEKEVAEKAVEAERSAANQVAETASRPIDQPAKSANHQPVSQETDQATGQVADQPASRSTNQPADQPSATKRPNVVDMADRRKRKRSAEADPKVVEKAEKYYRDKGKLPSERELADLAETTRYQAGKAIDHLKKKYNIDQSANRSASGR